MPRRITVAAISGGMEACVTAGASTPDWVIEEFVANLRNLPD